MPTQRFRIAITGKGALFRAKRWFYSSFYSNTPDDVKEENKRAWVSLAAKIIEEMNKRGVSDKPARLTIEYEAGSRGKFIPTSATLEVIEMRVLETINIHASEEAKKG
ncbi:MAG: hypothetical protein QXO15_00210 [Nitrososphaerota archaeon]